MEHYTDKQIDTMLNMYFRDHPRHAPWPDIAEAMGIEFNPVANSRVLWGVVTGYKGKKADAGRRDYHATDIRVNRAGWVWHKREEDCLRLALAFSGRERTPPVDIAYIAAVLARTPEEVAQKWEIMKNPTQMQGFGVV